MRTCAAGSVMVVVYFWNCQPAFPPTGFEKHSPISHQFLDPDREQCGQFGLGLGGVLRCGGLGFLR